MLKAKFLFKEIWELNQSSLHILPHAFLSTGAHLFPLLSMSSWPGMTGYVIFAFSCVCHWDLCTIFSISHAFWINSHILYVVMAFIDFALCFWWCCGSKQDEWLFMRVHSHLLYLLHRVVTLCLLAGGHCWGFVALQSNKSKSLTRSNLRFLSAVFIGCLMSVNREVIDSHI